MWKDNRRRHSERTRTWDLLHKYGHDYKVIFVGDATMSPYEILQPGGSVEYFNEEPGAVWIKRVTDVYPKCVWLNPEPEEIWAYRQSIGVVKELMNGRMYPDDARRPRAGDEAAGEVNAPQLEAVPHAAGDRSQAAQRNLPPGPWSYLIGGAETETTVRRNRQALDSIAFRPRVLRDVSRIDSSAQFLGRQVRLPVMLAPIGGLESIVEGGAAAAARARGGVRRAADAVLGVPAGTRSRPPRRRRPCACSSSTCAATTPGWTTSCAARATTATALSASRSTSRCTAGASAISSGASSSPGARRAHRRRGVPVRALLGRR